MITLDQISILTFIIEKKHSKVMNNLKYLF